jgi:hypothetical protein
MIPALPLPDHAAAQVKTKTLPLTGFCDQLSGALSLLEEIFDDATKYGPSSELQHRYAFVRKWFMQNYRPVRAVLSRGTTRQQAAIATWTLDGGSGDRLFRLIAPPILSDAEVGSDRWRKIVALSRSELKHSFEASSH